MNLFTKFKVCICELCSRRAHVLTFLISLFFISQQAFSQNKTNISGKVLGTDTLGIVGVNVLLKGTNLGTHTDVNGAFSLSVDKFPATLIISYVGHKTLELTVSEPNSDMQIVMEVSNNALNEVVVIGYGSASRAKLSSSITKVQGEIIAQQPIQNPVVGLQGRVAGLFMSVPSGNLGANPTINI